MCPFPKPVHLPFKQRTLHRAPWWAGPELNLKHREEAKSFTEDSCLHPHGEQMTSVCQQVLNMSAARIKAKCLVGRRAGEGLPKLLVGTSLHPLLSDYSFSGFPAS